MFPSTFSNGSLISQLICFARVIGLVTDFNAHNKSQNISNRVISTIHFKKLLQNSSDTITRFLNSRSG